MTVLGFAADESFVNFDDAAKLLNVLHEGRSDLVAHEPSGFVGAETHEAHDLQSAHAFLAGEHKVSDAEPIAEGFIRILEDRPGDMGEPIAGLRSAVVTLPMPRIVLQFGDFGPATRAADAFWPAATDQISAACVIIREHAFELGGGKLLDRLGLFAGHDGYPLSMG